jgi:hypothetical protein
MPVKTYEKLPVRIQAIQFNGSEDLSNVAEIIEFTDHKFRVRDIRDVGNSVITAEVYDELHETWVGVKDSDFIIKGIKGEFYPHDGPLFPQSYTEIWEQKAFDIFEASNG